MFTTFSYIRGKARFPEAYMDLKNQIIVSVKEAVTHLAFDQALRIPNKVALQAVYYPRFSEIDYYSLYIEDEFEVVHSVTVLVSGLSETTSDILFLISEALADFCEEKGYELPEVIWKEEERTLDGYSISMEDDHEYLF